MRSSFIFRSEGELSTWLVPHNKPAHLLGTSQHKHNFLFWGGDTLLACEEPTSTRNYRLLLQWSVKSHFNETYFDPFHHIHFYLCQSNPHPMHKPYSVIYNYLHYLLFIMDTTKIHYFNNNTDHLTLKKSNIPMHDVHGTRMFDSAVCSNVWYFFLEKKTLTLSFLFPFYGDGLCLWKMVVGSISRFLRIIFPFFVVSTLIFAFILIFLTHEMIFMTSGYIHFHSIRPPLDIFVTFIELYSLTCDRIQ